MSDILCARLEKPFSWDRNETASRALSPHAVELQPLHSNSSGKAFDGGSVTTFYDDSHFYVIADLNDQSIHNSATEMNQPMWALGDVFEVFLRPQSQEAYYEFHVTPENQILQLRFESALFYDKMRNLSDSKPLFNQSLISKKYLKTSTRILTAENRWQLLLSVPFSLICETHAWDPVEPWFASFCRYDYTAGEAQPVLSSTSTYPQPNFHDQSAWRRLLFHSGGSLL